MEAAGTLDGGAGVSFPRYPEYKDSGVAWLGEVPAHWGVGPLYSLVAERDEPNMGMLEENLLSLSYGRIIPKDINSNDGLLPESFETYQIVRPGDIVFRLTDLQNDKRSLRTAIVEETGIITSAYVAARPVGITPRYLSQLLRAYDVTKVFYSMGGGLRQSMKFSDLKRLPTLLPPPDEQAAISAFLDRETAKIDALVAEQEKLIALLKEKRQAVISHAVTKGLVPDVPMKDSGIDWLGEVPAHWEMTRLKFVAAIQTGVAKGKDNSGRKTVTVPYLRVANVQDGYLDLEDIADMEIPAEDLDRYTLRPGDVLMNEGGDFDKLGRGHVWNGEIEPCIHQNHVFAVRPVAVSSELLSWITSSDYAQFYFMGRSKQSTNLASISSSNIMELPVVLPPHPEQQEIAACLVEETGRLDDLVRGSEAAIVLLKERRSALISAAVTGKVDVCSFVTVHNT
jgi:type I restriction enzyme S subunit